MYIVNKTYGYHVYPEERLVIEVITGSINLKLMEQFKLVQLGDNEYSKEYDILSVHIDSEFNGLISEISEYVLFLKEYNFISSKDKIAVSVFQTPNQFAYISSLFKQLKSSDFGLYFTDSLEKGILHINKHYFKTEIEQMIQKILLNIQQ